MAPPPLAPENQLLAIAKAQKWAIYAILGTLISIPASLFIRDQSEKDLTDLMVIAVLLVSLVVVFAMVILRLWTIYALARALKIKGAPIVALFGLIDCVGLIILYSLNGRAIERLKKTGIYVGFFGVKKRDWPKLTSSPTS